MSEEKKQELENLKKQLSELDDKGLVIMEATVNALSARQKLEEHEKQDETAD